MRLRVCSLLLLFMALSIETTDTRLEQCNIDDDPRYEMASQIDRRIFLKKVEEEKKKVEEEKKKVEEEKKKMEEEKRKVEEEKKKVEEEKNMVEEEKNMIEDEKNMVEEEKKKVEEEKRKVEEEKKKVEEEKNMVEEEKNMVEEEKKKVEEEKRKVEEEKKKVEEEKNMVLPNSKKIFIYNPHLGYHHVHFMTTIANALDKAGHEVTMLDSLIYDDIKPLPYRSKTIRTMQVDQNPTTGEIAVEGETSENGLKAMWTDLPIVKKVRAFFSFYKSVTGFSKMVASQCEDVLKSDKFKEISESSYDLAITEAFDFCGVGMAHVMKVKKTILASSVPLHEYIGEKLGLPKTFDIVPTKFSMSTANEHRDDFKEYERGGLIKNAMESSLFGQNMFGYLEMKEAEIFQTKDPDFPGFETLLRKSHSLIENVHTLMDLSKPTLNAIIPIGGITHYETEKEQLTPEKKAEIDQINAVISNAKEKNEKVVLVSFGTVMKTPTMKNETIKNLFKAFAHVDNTIFIWKANTTNIDIPKNVHVRKWLPQNDLLASRKIDLFVSHMGIGSMTEAAYHGVPMVAIPIFVDQHYNYACAKRLKIAVFVDKYTLGSTSEYLRDAIQNALKDKTMKEHSSRLASNLKNFGNQTTKMMDHINFILSLPDKSESIAFLNHHHGLDLLLSVRSLFHLVPYYAVPITIVVSVIAIIILGLFLTCCCNGCQYVKSRFSKKVERTEANGEDSKQQKEKKEAQSKIADSPNANGTASEHVQPIETPEMEISFGIITLISVGFYCILFMLLASISSKFCPIANKMSEISEKFNISEISEKFNISKISENLNISEISEKFYISKISENLYISEILSFDLSILHMSTNTIFLIFIVFSTAAILLVLVYKLNHMYPYFHALSRFTTYICCSFIVIVFVLWGCKEYASSTYEEVRS